MYAGGNLNRHFFGRLLHARTVHLFRRLRGDSFPKGYGFWKMSWEPMRRQMMCG